MTDEEVKQWMGKSAHYRIAPTPDGSFIDNLCGWLVATYQREPGRFWGRFGFHRQEPTMSFAEWMKRLPKNVKFLDGGMGRTDAAVAYQKYVEDWTSPICIEVPLENVFLSDSPHT